MDLRIIHPDVLHRWTEEVLHLHALWHLGPPRNPSPNRVSGLNLRPETSTVFKKKARNRKKKKKVVTPPRSDNNFLQCLDPPPATATADEVECPTASAANLKTFPAKLNDLSLPPAAPAPLPVFAEEQASSDAVNAQQSALKASEDFLKEGSYVKGSHGDDHMDEDGEENNGAFNFFLQLFEKDGKLREYYVKNYKKGVFFCLVCGGTDVKKLRRLGNRMGLVQHANSVSKRAPEHRALLRAVCHVFGWDIGRLPGVHHTKGDDLCHSKSAVTAEERAHKDQVNGVENKENQKELIVRKELIRCLDTNEDEGPHVPIPDPKPSPTTLSDPAPLSLAVHQPLASDGGQACVFAAQAQQNGFKAVKDFFAKKDNLNDNADDCMDKVDDDSFKFFIDLFQKDIVLREYYMKNFRDGEFFCLVCKGTGTRKFKQFVNVASLLDHVDSLSNTKTRDAHPRAHRAFTRALYQEFGWNIAKRRQFACHMKDTLSQSSATSAKKRRKNPIDKNEDFQKEISESCSQKDAALSSEKITTESLPKGLLKICPLSSCSKAMEDNNMNLMKVDQE